MSNIKPFSTAQVCLAWLETQGKSKSPRPRGFGKSSGSGAWSDTCRRAATIVENTEYFDNCKDQIKVYALNAEPMMGPGFLLFNLFLSSLEDHLAAFPFYPTTAQWMEEGARMTVSWLSVEEVAKDAGVKPNTLRKRLDRLKTSLPFGRFTDDKRKWNIHPLDVPAIKAMFEEDEVVA